jgi:hypothetical protein
VSAVLQGALVVVVSTAWQGNGSREPCNSNSTPHSRYETTRSLHRRDDKHVGSAEVSDGGASASHEDSDKIDKQGIMIRKLGCQQTIDYCKGESGKGWESTWLKIFLGFAEVSVTFSVTYLGFYLFRLLFLSCHQTLITRRWTSPRCAPPKACLSH